MDPWARLHRFLAVFYEWANPSEYNKTSIIVVIAGYFIKAGAQCVRNERMLHFYQKASSPDQNLPNRQSQGAILVQNSKEKSFFEDIGMKNTVGKWTLGLVYIDFWPFFMSGPILRNTTKPALLW